jgi:hypothetical protein
MENGRGPNELHRALRTAKKAAEAAILVSTKEQQRQLNLFFFLIMRGFFEKEKEL